MKKDYISAQEALNTLIKHMLGDDWYIVDPVGAEQANYIAMKEIIAKYDKLNGTELKKRWNNLLDNLKVKI